MCNAKVKAICSATQILRRWLFCYLLPQKPNSYLKVLHSDKAVQSAHSHEHGSTVLYSCQNILFSSAVGVDIFYRSGTCKGDCAWQRITTRLSAT